MNNLKSGGTLFLAYKGRMGRATTPGALNGPSNAIERFFWDTLYIDLIEHVLKPSASKIWYVEDWQQKETQLCSFLLTNGKAW